MRPWDDDTIVIGGDSEDEDISFVRQPESEPEQVEKVPTQEELNAQIIEQTIVIGGNHSGDAQPDDETQEPADAAASEQAAEAPAEEEVTEEQAETPDEPEAESESVKQPAEDTAGEAEASCEAKEAKPSESDVKAQSEKDDAPEVQSATEQKPASKPAPVPVSKTVAADISPAAAADSPDEQVFDKKFLVTSSPHLHSGESTRVIMQDVCIALMPAAIVSGIYFGWRSILTIAVCVITCVLSEFICRKVMKRRQTIGDFSAVVTGMLLAFCLPPEINPLYAIIGSVVAIVVVKQMFGGIGMNFANPAVTARIVLFLSFTTAMNTFSRPFYYLGELTVDAVSSATPLAIINQSGDGNLSVFELFLGNHAGSLGETCAVALLLGGGYLLLRGVISWEIPVCFMGTVMVFSLLLGLNPLVQLLTGGVVLGAVFMATDYTTSPINKRGKIVFGIGCGLLTMIIRQFASMPEGVSFAILIMNILVPHIECLTASKPFGEEHKAA